MKLIPKIFDPTDITTFINKSTGKHVISDGLSVIPIYKGKQYSIKDVVNADGTVNVRKAKKIMEEVAEYFGGKKMLNRLENPIWHKEDPNTWLHTKKVAKLAWSIPVPEGYTKQDLMVAALGHDFGKILSGDGHAEVSYNLIKLIFPDATEKLLNAIRRHMDPIQDIAKGSAKLSGSVLLKQFETFGKNIKRYKIQDSGKEVGEIGIILSPRDKTITIEAVSAEKGKGYGLKAYEAISKEFPDYTIVSDSEALSADAEKMWDRLVQKNKAEKLGEKNYKYFTTPDNLMLSTKYADLGITPTADLTSLGLTPEELQAIQSTKWFKDGGNMDIDKIFKVKEALNIPSKEIESIDWDSIFNDKSDEWIEAIYKLDRNDSLFPMIKKSYLTNLKDNSEFVNFITQNWEQTKKKAKKENKNIKASIKNLLEKPDTEGNTIIIVKTDDNLVTKATLGSVLKSTDKAKALQLTLDDILFPAEKLLAKSFPKRFAVAEDGGKVFKLFETTASGEKKLIGKLDLNIELDFIYPKYIKNTSNGSAKGISRDLYDAAMAYHGKPLQSGFDLLTPAATLKTWSKYFDKTELTNVSGKHKGESGTIMALNLPSQKVDFIDSPNGEIIVFSKYDKLPEKVNNPWLLTRQKQFNDVEEHLNNNKIMMGDEDVTDYGFESRALDDDDEWLRSIVAGIGKHKEGGNLIPKNSLGNIFRLIKKAINIPTSFRMRSLEEAKHVFNRMHNGSKDFDTALSSKGITSVSKSKLTINSDYLEKLKSLAKQDKDWEDTLKIYEYLNKENIDIPKSSLEAIHTVLFNTSGAKVEALQILSLMANTLLIEGGEVRTSSKIFEAIPDKDTLKLALEYNPTTFFRSLEMSWVNKAIRDKAYKIKEERLGRLLKFLKTQTIREVPKSIEYNGKIIEGTVELSNPKINISKLGYSYLTMDQTFTSNTGQTLKLKPVGESVILLYLKPGGDLGERKIFELDHKYDVSYIEAELYKKALKNAKKEGRSELVLKDFEGIVDEINKLDSTFGELLSGSNLEFTSPLENQAKSLGFLGNKVILSTLSNKKGGKLISKNAFGGLVMRELVPQVAKLTGKPERLLIKELALGTLSEKDLSKLLNKSSELFHPGGAPVAAEYLLTGNPGTVKSTAYFLLGLNGVFPEIEQDLIKTATKYKDSILSLKNISDFSKTKLYEDFIKDLAPVIAEKYGERGIQALEIIKNRPTGLYPKEGQLVEQLISFKKGGRLIPFNKGGDLMTIPFKPSQEILDFIKLYEAFVPYVYDDKAGRDKNGKPIRYVKGTPVKGKLTIGYGETGKDIIDRHLGGPDITKEDADKYFKTAVDVRVPRFLERTPNYKKLNLNLLDSLFSYFYNIGEYAYKHKNNNLLEGLQNLDHDKVVANIDFGYNLKGMGGLRKRRDAEREWYKKAVAEAVKQEKAEEKLQSFIDFLKTNLFKAKQPVIRSTPTKVDRKAVDSFGVPYNAKMQRFADRRNFELEREELLRRLQAVDLTFQELGQFIAAPVKKVINYFSGD